VRVRARAPRAHQWLDGALQGPTPVELFEDEWRRAAARPLSQPLTARCALHGAKCALCTRARQAQRPGALCAQVSRPARLAAAVRRHTHARAGIWAVSECLCAGRCPVYVEDIEETCAQLLQRFPSAAQYTLAHRTFNMGGPERRAPRPAPFAASAGHPPSSCLPAQSSAGLSRCARGTASTAGRGFSRGTRRRRSVQALLSTDRGPARAARAQAVARGHGEHRGARAWPPAVKHLSCACCQRVAPRGAPTATRA